mmetsp:Transcript_102488/g.294033  ORF Transcript_102488/g.294033 Transcript_102488/m.294033 type:complete len:231 (+) Transcript_102488:1000-1692(+)
MAHCLIQQAALRRRRCQDRTHARSQSIACHTRTGRRDCNVVAAPQQRCHQTSIHGDICDMAMLLEETECDVQHVHTIVPKERTWERGNAWEQRRVLVQCRAQLIHNVRGQLAKLAHRVHNTCKVKLWHLTKAHRSLPKAKHIRTGNNSCLLARLGRHGLARTRALNLANSRAFFALGSQLGGPKTRNPDEEDVAHGCQAEHCKLHPDQGRSLGERGGEERGGLEDRHVCC